MSKTETLYYSKYHFIKINIYKKINVYVFIYIYIYT